LHATDGTRGDTILGLAPDFKFTQQDLTELNGDGNRERGRYGEDKAPPKDPPILKEEEEDDGQPSLYEEYQAVFGGDDSPDQFDENPSW
jgi:hypothetical protein